MFNKIALVGAAVFLVSCVSSEYREEKGICEARWIKKIPPRLEQEWYQMPQFRQVPTGQVTCTTVGGFTNCNQIMTTEVYYVPAVRTVDRNSYRRDPQISACTQKKCIAKYGNKECKVK